MVEALTEVRHVVRSLIRDRRFALMALLVVAPGAVLSAFLLNLASLRGWRPPVPDGIVYVDQIDNGGVFGVSHATILALQERRGVFERLVYKSEDRGRIPERGTALWVGEMVSGGYFEILGLQPALGRALVLTDDSPNADRNIVISERLWRGVFSSDKNILGKTLRISPAFRGARSEEAPHYTIVGVMPDRASRVSSPFQYIDYWVPVTARVADYACDLDMYSFWAFTGIGRLANGVTFKQAEAAVETIWRTILDHNSPGLSARRSIRLSSTPNFALPHDRSRIGVSRVAVLASALAVVVIVVTLANLSGLLMLRAARRRPADATRVALGGGPWLASRTVLVEGLTIGGAAAVIALVLMRATVAAIQASVELPVDTSGIPLGRTNYSSALLCGSCVLFGLLAGVLPAYQCRPATLTNELAGRSAQAPRLRNQLLIVVPQVALATAVMIIALAVGFSVLRIEMADPGYDVDKLVYARFVLPTPATCNQDRQTLRAARQDIRVTVDRVLLNVTQVMDGQGAVSSGMPFERLTNWIVSRDAVVSDPFRIAETSVSAAYREVLGLRLLSGRFFDGSEAADGNPVAVVSAATAAHLWKGDPLGRQIAFAHPSDTRAPATWLTVIGVVGDVQTPLSEGDVTPWVYTPLSQRPGGHWVVLRSPTVDRFVVRTLRNSVVSANNRLIVQEAASVESIVASRRYPRRLSALVLGTCCLLTSWLACAGLYSLMSYATARRVWEFGICMALGAERSRIRRMALRGGLTYAAIGIVPGIGLGGEALLLIGRLIGQIPPLTAGPLLALAALLCAVLTLASLGPVRIVASIDPSRLFRET